MKTLVKILFFVSAFGAVGFGAGGEPAGDGLVFRGASDASGAVAISENLIVVADDENNVLRVYRAGQGGMPVSSYNLTGFLRIDLEYPEADIEGATMIGGRIYWITSHGRNRDGKMRPNRYRFFATAVQVTYGQVGMRRVGSPSTTLVHELLEIPSARRLRLDRATRFGEDLKKKEREKLAPKKEGLNIEALCASADGETIYIGFRNPTPGPRSRAIVVPLLNADRVLELGEASVFGEPLLWNLAGLGIRSMEYSHFHEAYFIIAGSPGEDDEFALYRWPAKWNAQPTLVQELTSYGAKFKPEALVPFADGRFLLLSDDGALRIKVNGPEDCLEGEYRDDGTCLNKYLADPAMKTFRGVWLELPSL